MRSSSLAIAAAIGMLASGLAGAIIWVMVTDPVRLAVLAVSGDHASVIGRILTLIW